MFLLYPPDINLTVLLCAVHLRVCARVCVCVCVWISSYLWILQEQKQSLSLYITYSGPGKECGVHQMFDVQMDWWMNEGWASKLARLYQWAKMRCLPTVTRWHRGSPRSVPHQTPGTQAVILPGASRTSELGKFQSPGRVGKCPSTNTSHSWCSTERESQVFFIPKPCEWRDDSSIFLPFACFDSRIICKDANKGKKTIFPRKWFTA